MEAGAFFRGDMDELTIINSMLAVIGEHPVSSVNSLHPTVVIARQLLSSENEQMQGKGWFFNTEYGVTLKPAADGRVVVPSNTLRIKSPGGQLAQRGTVLYNMDGHTDIFTEDVQVDITYRVDIEDLPPNAATYLNARACYKMFLNEDGEGRKMQELKEERERAYQMLNTEHIHFLGRNFSTSPASLRVLKK